MLRIKKSGLIGKTYRHINRYKQIVGILLKYGLDDLREKVYLKNIIPGGTKEERKAIGTLSRPKRMRMALEELGPTFIKLGQLLSTRPDLIPLEYVQELSELQDNVSPFPINEVNTIIKDEFGRIPEDIFEHFDVKPIAAASIAQVHRARLNTGDEVVVKIGRPNLRETLEVDLEILHYVVPLISNRLRELEIQQPIRILEIFAQSIEKEIDFSIEKAHIERFSRQFANDKTIHVPMVHSDLSTEKILTIEYINGIKATRTLQLKEDGYNLEEIASRGTYLAMKQIFEHGFFHADPHPGNVFILPNNVLCLIDFGSMGRLTATEQSAFVELINGIVSQRNGEMVESLLSLTAYSEPPDKDRLERDLAELVDRYIYLSLKQLEIGKLLKQLIIVISRHGLSLKPDLFLMIKAMSSVEVLAKSLDSNFEIYEYLELYFKRFHLRKYDPRKVIQELRISGADLAKVVKEIPIELRNILKYIRKGNLKVQFEHKGLDSLIHSNEQISNRIAFAIVLAALIVGSSLIIHADVPPRWNDIPIVGLFGFIIAGIMGFWLLITIIKHGKM